MPYTPNNPLIPGDPSSYDLKWIVQQIKAWKDPLDSAERAEDAAEAAALSAAEAQAAAGTIDQPFVTPEMFGAEGDGTTDDRAAFTAAFATGKPVFCHGGKTYGVEIKAGDTNAISIPAGGVLNLNGATIQLLNPNSLDTYNVIDCNNITGAIIFNGEIKGDKLVHVGSSGEHAHGITIFDSHNIIVQNVKISNCWGDGVYIGGWTKSSHIIVKDVHCYNNRRNGISLVNGSDVKIEGCTLEDTNGTAPQLGIDVETDLASYYIDKVVISDCSFINNPGGALNIYIHGDDASIICKGLNADGAISVDLKGVRSRAVLTDINSKPKNGQDAFVAGCVAESAVIFDDFIVDAGNILTAVCTFAYDEPHENISLKGKVTNGTLDRIIRSYTQDHHNCSVELTMDDSVVVNNLDEVLDNTEPSNYTDIYYTDTRDTNVYLKAVTLNRIPDSASSANVNLWYGANQRIWHALVNDDSVQHNAIGSTFEDITTGTQANLVNIAAGAAMYYKYDPIKDVVYYYMSA